MPAHVPTPRRRQVRRALRDARVDACVQQAARRTGRRERPAPPRPSRSRCRARARPATRHPRSHSSGPRCASSQSLHSGPSAVHRTLPGWLSPWTIRCGPRPARPARARRPADLGQRAGRQAARLGEHRERLELSPPGRVGERVVAGAQRAPRLRRRRPRPAARATATASPRARPPRTARRAARAPARRRRRERRPAAPRGAGWRPSRGTPSVAPVSRAANGPGSRRTSTFDATFTTSARSTARPAPRAAASAA